jgi:hypothetical protein
MRVSSLFRRTQVEGLVIARNDGEDPSIGLTERRNLGRRQSNSSNAEVRAPLAASSAAPSPIEEASTKAAPTQPPNLPTSNPDVGTYFA